ncbi:histidine kinase-like protein [Haloactinospora alba]|uniref:Histidine kinase-like protein n=1 Tax=Haloactinospora alba TaxID=405555 RepID=A0A543N7F4_9ACTN|nr:ATP-binding protein [Haloactinospora alba]TQN27764.1 histidine kinase-like protein [Haloactinospora alba]
MSQEASNARYPQLPHRLPGYSTWPQLDSSARRHGGRFGPTPDQVAAARRWVRTITALPPSEANDLDVVVSELVTNALKHSASGQDGDITLRVGRLHTGSIRIAVTDNGPRIGQDPTFLHWPEADPGLDSGRGLLLVSEMSRRVGVLGEVGGPLTVWAVLDRARNRG